MPVDAIVVGAGIAGAAVAHALATRGRQCLILDAADPAGGATAAGMGHIVVMDDSEAQFALTSYSRALLDSIVPQLPAACEADRCGTLWLAEDAAQLDSVRSKHEYYRARGIATEMLDAAALRAAEPQLRPGLAGALRVPDDLVLYPPALAAWLLREACERGARIVRERVIALEAQAAVTARTRYAAPVVVLATGAAAPALIPGLPVVPRRGHLVVTERHPDFARHQLVELGYLQSAHTLDGASVAFNVQPRRTQQLLIGSSRELVGWDTNINRDIVARMLQRAVAFMPALARLRALRTWIGFRPATSDKLPLIGAWAPLSGVWLATGHEGLGITTALGTAQLLAALIDGGATAIDPLPYSPARVLPGAPAVLSRPHAPDRA